MSPFQTPLPQLNNMEVLHQWLNPTALNKLRLAGLGLKLPTLRTEFEQLRKKILQQANDKFA